MASKNLLDERPGRKTVVDFGQKYRVSRNHLVTGEFYKVYLDRMLWLEYLRSGKNAKILKGKISREAFEFIVNNTIKGEA